MFFHFLSTSLFKTVHWRFLIHTFFLYFYWLKIIILSHQMKLNKIKLKKKIYCQIIFLNIIGINFHSFLTKVGVEGGIVDEIVTNLLNKWCCFGKFLKVLQGFLMPLELLLWFLDFLCPLLIGQNRGILCWLSMTKYVMLF